MKTVKFIFLSLFVSMMVLISTSCKKEVNPVDNPEPVLTGFQSLKIPDGFTWTTINKSGFEVYIVDAAGNYSNQLDGFPLDATDPTGNLLQRTSIINGKALFYLELNSTITEVRLYSPSHGIEQYIDLAVQQKAFVLPPKLKSAKAYTDSDGDGVYDDFDQYPDDPEKAYRVTYPSPYNATGFKSGKDEDEVWYYQLFEDLWPTTGDYDMNDLIIKLRMVVEFNAQSEWVSGTFDFYIWTNGAAMDLGCGIEFYDYVQNVDDKYEFKYLNPNQIELTDVSDPTFIDYDPDVDNAVIIFNNADDFKPIDYWNTGQGTSYDPTETYLSFSYTASPPTNWMAGFLYLYRTSDRSHEVRPIGIPPTAAANTALLGTSNDASPTDPWVSTPGTTFLYPLDPPYYATENGHPWGIEIEFDGNFIVPFEKVSILDAYPDFASWAESGGENNPEWYLNPSTDPTKVFDVGALIIEE
jgi:LruC domain-containing protein